MIGPGWRLAFSAAALVGLALPACDRDKPDEPSPLASAAPSSAAAVPAASPSASGPAAAPELAPLTSQEFARLFRELSEPNAYFFSDNYVSNETSYLQVAEQLAARAHHGGAYIGVGPEQNFSYVALLRPKLAFIVDIRRDNALEHLLYKSIFEQAETRSHFLALLTGREWSKDRDPGANADVQAVIGAASRKKLAAAAFATSHEQLVRHIEALGIALSAKDRTALESIHQAFYDGGVELEFELHEKNGRDYPSLKELLSQTAPNGKALGFLATEAAFRSVQELQKKNRVIPVVGDFAGTHAFQRIAAELEKRDLAVMAFYVSNVEQYVLDPPKWKNYVANVEALPTAPESVFIRCYLDQGRRHPQQLEGHRTATVLASFDHFERRQRARGYGSFWQVATDGVLGADGGR